MEKIPVGILGATGMVGQKFIELLADHPWFEVTAIAASDRSLGKLYRDSTQWRMATPLPSYIADMPLSPCQPPLPCDILFSGLDSSVAGDIELQFANAGYTVISNARNHRMDPKVPLLIPEVNPDHLRLLDSGGHIITNPNCSVIGIATALKPLLDRWGISQLHVTTLQAVSGAGYPGVASFDILDNVIPFISGEEEKVESEPLKIFGTFRNGQIEPYPMKISAHCNRVAVMDGHLACVSVKLLKPATFDEIVEAWETFPSIGTPSAPSRPIIYHEGENHPQPKLHRQLENGMSVSVGRLRPCSLLDWKFVLLSHNTVRGAAGCALLNAELFLEQIKLTI